MGGYGSGTRWSYSRKCTVEDCLSLDVTRLFRDGMLRANTSGSGLLVWRITTTGEEVSSLAYEFNTRNGHAGWMRLQYRFHDERGSVEYPVSLTTTPLPWGGERWWFRCPLSIGVRYCGRRVRKLHRPAGARYFGCRRCYDLTYTSCQESHKYDRMWAMVAAECGRTPQEVKREWEEEAAFERKFEQRLERRRRKRDAASL